MPLHSQPGVTLRQLQMYIRHLSISNFQTTLSGAKVLHTFLLKTNSGHFHFDPLRSLKTIVNGPSSSTGSYTFHTARHFHLKAFLRRSEWKQMHVDIMLSITLCISETAELDKMLPCICGHPMAQHDGYNGRASVPCDISLTQNSNSHFDRDWP